MLAVMQSVPDTGNGKRFWKKKKNGRGRSLHLYMRRMADGGLPLKMQSEKENKPSFWRAKSPVKYPIGGQGFNALLSLSVRQRDGFRHCDGRMPEGSFHIHTNKGRRRDAAGPSECRREVIHDGKKTDHGIFK